MFRSVIFLPISILVQGLLVPSLLVPGLLVPGLPIGSVNASEPALSKPIQSTRNLVYREIEGEKVMADVFRPDNETVCPAVLLIHGGGWCSGDKWHMHDHARQLAQAGYVAVSINYRLAPRHLITEQIDDCRAALRWWAETAPKFHADPERIALWGYSAGAHLSCLIAAQPTADAPPIAAVVAGGAPCDFSNIPEDSEILSLVMGGSPRDLPDLYHKVSPIHFASRAHPPALFYHGTQDWIVPPKSSRLMFEKLKKYGVTTEYHRVVGQGHLTAFIDAQARIKAIKFLNQHLPMDY